jgi:hypothetical protein
MPGDVEPDWLPVTVKDGALGARIAWWRFLRWRSRTGAEGMIRGGTPLAITMGTAASRRAHAGG